MRFIPLLIGASLLCSALSTNAQAQGADDGAVPELDFTPRPIDYGPGPGVPLSPAAPAAEVAGMPAIAGANATGAFSQPLTWPLIPIHAIVLPDGRVLTYGTNENGAQGARVVYEVWNPKDPVTPHTLLPNTLLTDFFCGAQSLLLGSGNALLAGGDAIVNGVRNFSNDRTTIFDVTTNGLTDVQPTMLFRRWYATLVPLSYGSKLILGGREDKGIATITPEVYDEATGWRTLFNATSDPAFGMTENHWYYPRAYQHPNDPGSVVYVTHNGDTYRIQPGGLGAITRLSPVAPKGDFRLPTAMYAPGKLLSVRKSQVAVAIDINGPEPVITPVPNVNKPRFWSTMAVLADGKVLLSGGSEVANQLSGVTYDTQIWDPATGAWTTGASAAKPRLYHSIALLLPDATVLTGGGGVPGPVMQLNAEIYYPPYLYDASGQPAARPLLLSAPPVVNAALEPQFLATVASGNQISRVTLVHTGSVTHSTNVEQRFQDLSFVQSGQTLVINSPTNPNYTVAGYYMLFAFNPQGVPSEAKIVKIRYGALASG